MTPANDQSGVSGMTDRDGGTETGMRESLVYDFDLKAPACVLLQAAFGCYDSKAAFRHFDSRHWLTSPTPGMRKVSGTDDQWRRAAEVTRQEWGDRDPNRQVANGGAVPVSTQPSRRASRDGPTHSRSRMK